MPTINDAIKIAKALENEFTNYDKHLAIGGSCMYKGESDHDIDLLVYPHNSMQKQYESEEILNTILKRAGFTNIKSMEAGQYEDPRPVWESYSPENHRVEFIFL